MKEKILRRCTANKWIGGVCSGLGRFFGMDPTIWRLIFLCGALFSVIIPFTLIYIIMWIVIPKYEKI
jgi:phage shock protein PspC (stress-responsive transcriptional regulator)